MLCSYHHHFKLFLPLAPATSIKTMFSVLNVLADTLPSLKQYFIYISFLYHIYFLSNTYFENILI